MTTLEWVFVISVVIIFVAIILYSGFDVDVDPDSFID